MWQGRLPDLSLTDIKLKIHNEEIQYLNYDKLRAVQFHSNLLFAYTFCFSVVSWTDATKATLININEPPHLKIGQ